MIDCMVGMSKRKHEKPLFVVHIVGNFTCLTKLPPLTRSVTEKQC